MWAHSRKRRVAEAKGGGKRNVDVESQAGVKPVRSLRMAFSPADSKLSAMKSASHPHDVTRDGVY